MTITSQLLEAYLQCPTKCRLRSTGEQVTDSTYASFTHTQNESFGAAQIRRLLSKVHQSEYMISPSPNSVKTGRWRLATRVVAQTSHLESCLHAVEHLPSAGRGKPGHYIAIRFVPTNRISKDAKLLLAFDALALSEMLGTRSRWGRLSTPIIMRLL